MALLGTLHHLEGRLFPGLLLAALLVALLRHLAARRSRPASVRRPAT
ncbi:MAG TPA: hypothetical protein PKO45_09270 [Rubrivivax sp.]|nr:hypothetical protein [Rubrivivax sp.]